MTPAIPERAAELIRRLALVRHPEGGYYHEIFRASRVVAVRSGVGVAPRSALTAIYFLLLEQEPSRWHSVGSDEVWHHVEGAPIEIYSVDPVGHDLQRRRLGPADGDQAPVLAVHAGHWQAARAMGPYALAGCSVGPGFEFADFKLLRDDPAMTRRVRDAFPELAGLI